MKGWERQCEVVWFVGGNGRFASQPPPLERGQDMFQNSGLGKTNTISSQKNETGDKPEQQKTKRKKLCKKHHCMFSKCFFCQFGPYDLLCGGGGKVNDVTKIEKIRGRMISQNDLADFNFRVLVCPARKAYIGLTN